MNGYGLSTSLKPGMAPGVTSFRARWPEYLPLNRSFDDSVNDLVNYLHEFANLSRRQRIELRNRTERLSELFDWSALASHYHEAHDLALQRTGGTRPGTFELRVV